MKKPVEDCKAMWRSLRDSMRYHAGGKKKFKSGSEADVSGLDGGENESLEDDSYIDWEFAASMSFLTPLSSQKRRRTFNSSDIENDSPSCSNQSSTFGNAIQMSNYAYLNESRKPKDPLIETAADLSKNISELIDFQKQRAATATPPLKHLAMLANIDRMLQKLPDDVVEDLNVSFTSQIYEEIKKIRNKND